VFPLLTKYLLHYKKVSIPNIGSFIIEQQPAELNFIDRLIQPPHYKVVFKDNEAIDDDLVTFIGANTDIDFSSARQKLELFGNALKSKLLEAPFVWNGIGRLEYTDGVIFHPKEIETALQPVVANRVIRDNAQHAVLVGEQEMQSGSVEQAKTINEGNTPGSVTQLVGWLLLAVAVAFIGYYFYTQHNIKDRTGLQMEIKPRMPEATHK
jgi:hypothetical protein